MRNRENEGRERTARYGWVGRGEKRRRRRRRREEEEE